jgi:O-antigen/teichoic acid export membrane protein
MAVDQGILSLATLFVNLLLIHRGTKPEYALFCIVMSCILLGQSVQNGAVCTPLVVLGGRLGMREIPTLTSYLQRINLWGALGAAVICGGLTFIVPGRPVGPGLGLATGAALAVVGLWLREYRRTRQLREDRLGSLLGGDVVMGIVLVSGLWLTMRRGMSISALSALAAIGLANLVVSWGLVAPGGGGSERPSMELRREWKRQAIPATTGAIVAWLQGASYPILVATAAGTHAAADIAAARLFVSPGFLLATAWGRLGLVKATEALRVGGVVEWKSFARSQAAWVAAGAAAYVLIVGLAVTYGAGRVLGRDYQDPTLVWCWLVVGFITMIRSVAAIVLQASGDFTELLRWATLSTLVACASVLILGSTFGAAASILGLGIGEILNGVAFFVLVARKRPAGH